MQQYEIRILREDGSAALIVAAVHLNDPAAIRSARYIARDRKFEVWRGLDCVYGPRGLRVISPSAPDFPAA